MDGVGRHVGTARPVGAVEPREEAVDAAHDVLGPERMEHLERVGRAGDLGVEHRLA